MGCRAFVFGVLLMVASPASAATTDPEPTAEESAENETAPAEPSFRNALFFEANAGGLGSNAGVYGALFGLGAGVRLLYLNAGGFVHYGFGAGTVTSYGGFLGPSFPLASFTLEVAATGGIHDFNAIGARTNATASQSHVTVGGAGCFSDGANGTSGFVGGRIGIAKKPSTPLAGRLGLFLEYQRDLKVSDPAFTVQCGGVQHTEHTSVGGDTVLLLFQIGAIQAL